VVDAERGRGSSVELTVVDEPLVVGVTETDCTVTVWLGRRVDCTRPL